MTDLLNAKQIWLLAYENPLKKRLGPEFFWQIPKVPGVYWMLGEDQQILYVGKAKNLRSRINSYRQVKPDKSSRKLLRLIHLVCSIDWELCESEEKALLRENELLRKHRPPYNVVNTHPENYYFIGFTQTSQTFDFKLTTSPLIERFELFGTFKGRALTRQAFGALLRLLWASLGDSESTLRFEFPGVLIRRNTPYSYSLILDEQLGNEERDVWAQLLRKFLLGTSKTLVIKLTERLLEKTQIPPFMYHFIQENIGTLEEFFKFGPHRNQCLKRFHKISDPIVPQDKIDDLLVTYNLRSPA